jgi:RNA polymerase sigma-70 factor (ECF subfamily)
MVKEFQSSMRPLPKLAQLQFVPSPAQRALALKLVTEMDLLRLKTIARWYARGLPPHVSWEDLLQEAFARVLSGSRRQPEGVTTLVFLVGVIRSLRAAHLRRARTSGTLAREESAERHPADVDEAAVAADGPADPAPDPEHAVSSLQQIAAIERLFSDDAIVLRIIEGLAEGLTAEQIRSAHGISPVEYDSARKRMRRILLREGLTCGNL